MLKKLLPVLLALSGLGIGTGAGMVLRDDRPSGAPGEATSPPGGAEPEASAPAPIGQGRAGAGDVEAPADPTQPVEYVRFSNQFVVPIVEQGKVASMIVLALSLEVNAGQTERVYAFEPKLRDTLLQVMFDHANSGGFSGDFTDATVLAPLRDALREAAIRVFGPEVRDVLISDIMRQDG